MNSKLWIQKALSSCLLLAMIATYSMVGLASTGKAAGELSVFGITTNGETPFVLVNGEAAQNGRSVFSTSNISTSDTVSAVVNMGKAGTIKIAPSTTLSLSFDEFGAHGVLSSGSVSSIGTSSINIQTADGDTVKLNAGETVAATGAKAQDDDDDDNSGGAAWFPWAIIFGGAAAGIIWAAVEGDNNTNLGGGGVIVSPNS